MKRLLVLSFVLVALLLAGAQEKTKNRKPGLYATLDTSMGKIVVRINAFEDNYAQLTDAQLRGLSDTLRARIGEGETLDALLPEAFAAVREASKRTLGQRHYDVQLIGGAPG